MGTLSRERGKGYNMLSTVDHALMVIEYLSEKQEAGVSEISNSIGLAPSTTHRLIASLTSREYLIQNPKTRKYQLGIKIFQLGSTVANRFGIRQAALINMEKLAIESGETVNLGILDKTSVIYLEKILNDDPIRIELQVGRAVPAHCTGLGKAILAFQPQDKLDALLKVIRFHKRTKNTIVERGVLRKELETIRERGFAMDNGELIEGIRCIAVPVFSQNNTVVAAISIAGPTFRLDDKKIDELVPLVRRSAEETSKYIGYVNTVSM
jgi:DNA-binding IclR family transcriptional regulator